MKSLKSLIRDNRASSAAEFALVLPLLLIFLLGILDVGRLMWTWNKAEKATQIGVRYAVVTDVAAGELSDFKFTVDAGVGQGNAVPATVFDYLICTEDNDCSDCSGTACNSIDPSLDSDAFDALVGRMQTMFREIGSENVEVEYRNVGLGFAGDPNGADVSPLVTVRFREDNPITFTPILSQIFGVTISLPSFSAALTMEDGQGAVSN
ncbi:TadE-like protein [Sphingobium herbicidovorans NBRC 16415]|uniref:TadE-like protein n=1 Tax=Sphingobium herbicidovorans (strain ATCC 700291 / DSM 11019 / CCUG 56400 / KCTC 2939 / LMG 18315 / NBRC 16415 / MH) TaxID=1219045 RepID=A0A086P8C4_SPHHM|nr:TadE/TadG family type IV pilus assembly protein [Sphingobium herbicidovorans]KFG89642.1 TadE-like protein [Sphingobium herbicidovorans NBRC 16415]